MVHPMELQGVDLGFPAVPAFLTKLRLLVDDEDTKDIIYWDPSGNSFHISDGNRLAKEVLPLFFKHNNLSSFIRQLNMYGFRKVNRIDPCPALKMDVEDMEFRHPFFVRQKPHLLSKIQRKPTSTLYNGRFFIHPSMTNVNHNQAQSTFANSGEFPQSIPVASEFMRLSGVVRTLRNNQEMIAQQVNFLKSENQLLASELHDLRERYVHQSQLIQTLFSFLSAFAKDGRSQNYRFSPKRKALPFAVSSVIPANSRSGLKLNLPKGFLLDDPSSFQSIKIAPSDELHETPFKLAKVDNSALVTLTNPSLDSSFALEGAGPSTSRTLQYIPSPTLLSVNDLALPDNKLVLSSVPDIDPSSNQSADPVPRKPNNLAVLPLVAADVQQLGPVGSVQQARPNMKRTFAETDRTLASLTQGLSPPAGTEKANETLAGSENMAFDLNLSRCTTPVSLIQPDSLDIAEFFAARDDNVSDISLEDLFLASTNGADISANSRPSKLTTKVDKTACISPRSGRSSVDSEATLPFEDLSLDNQLRTPVLQSNPPESSNVLRSALTKLDPSLAKPELGTADPAVSVAPVTTTGKLSTQPIDDQIAPAEQRISLLVDSTQSAEEVLQEDGSLAVDDQELFGLPWEEQEVVVEDEEHQLGDNVDQFSTVLLPVSERSNARLKAFSTPREVTIKPTSTLPRTADKFDHNLIIGSEIIPAEAALPFANVPTTIAHFMQPSPVSPTSQPTRSVTSVPTLPRQNHVILNQSQARLVQTTVPKSVTSIPSNQCFVQTTSLCQPVLATPIALPAQLLSLRPLSIGHSTPVYITTPRQSRVPERRQRPTYRAIAPAVKSTTPPTNTNKSTSINK
ncbi:stress-responsive transcription factor hsf1 [Clonorchis sinensis]|uniref:Stress-responsive transcription factor hsf1 n=1 Tax=Clonorchis sinensis TaxID=79923 RepID=A0A8T1M154_CLOSI|nr:stress-responsive transcription factor hsf1 [Clonorchis sinensis]